MTNLVEDTSRSKAAIVAGLGLLIMTIFYMSAELFIFQNLIVPGDATTTANNIMASETLFRIGICCFLIVIVCDVVVAWALYVFLKPVNKSLSLLVAWFRLVYSTIFGIALFNYFNIFQLLNGSDYLAVFEPAHLHAQVMLSINAFSDGWAIGFVFFGLHLALLGYLSLKSDYIPKIFGVLLLLAGLSYLIDHFSKFLFPNFNVNISMLLGWGELIFMFWLLIKGTKIEST
jgi:Domain of unknown function (DUF4386)